MPADNRGPLPPVAPPPAAKPPPPVKRPQMSAPTPSPEGFMSTAAKMSLADVAFALRDEQLQAKVVLYKAELETSPELDAVTQQVIRELHGLQAAARAKTSVSGPPSGDDRTQLE